MSKPPLGGRQRVTSKKKRTASSRSWLERQLNDPYVKKAQAEGYRSRAAYKLIELDERFALLKGVKRVIDLGIAPGGWAQVVKRRNEATVVVGIDLLEVDPISGVTILQMDFMDEDAPDALMAALEGPADLVLSDMAANTVGHQQTDHLRTMALVEAGADFAGQVLRPGGAYVAKVLAGGADHTLVALLKRMFTTVKHAKPPASRKDSSEWYVIAQGFKGGAQREVQGSEDITPRLASPAFAGAEEGGDGRAEGDKGDATSPSESRSHASLLESPPVAARWIWRTDFGTTV